MIRVSLIAPSYPVSLEDVRQVNQYFEDTDLNIAPFSQEFIPDLLCAGPDEARFSHLEKVLQDPLTDVIWLLRGGYGLSRLAPFLLKMEKPLKEKLFVGFSDGTVLHMVLTQEWGWTTLHGTTATQLSSAKVSQPTIESTLRLLREGLGSYSPPFLKPMNRAAHAMSLLSGYVTGGNLCIVTCSLGTAWQIKASGKILFLEDVDERGYCIDRMLMHLDQAGIFEQVQAIIFGDFVEGKEANGTSLIPDVLERFAPTLRAPVFTLQGCGHGFENFPLPFNVFLNFPVIG